MTRGVDTRGVDTAAREARVAAAATPTLVGTSPSHAPMGDPSPRLSSITMPPAASPLSQSQGVQSVRDIGLSIFTPVQEERRVAKASNKPVLTVWSDEVLEHIVDYAYGDFKGLFNGKEITIDCEGDNPYIQCMKSGEAPTFEPLKRFVEIAWHYMPHIKAIIAPDWHINPKQLQFLATHCIALQRVHLSAYNLKSVDFRALQKLPAMREIHLERCRSITSPAFLELHKCSRLTSLVLNGAPLLFQAPTLLVSGARVRSFSPGALQTMAELMKQVQSLVSIRSDEATYSRESDQKGDAEDYARTCLFDPQGLTKIGVKNCIGVGMCNHFNFHTFFQEINTVNLLFGY